MFRKGVFLLFSFLLFLPTAYADQFTEGIDYVKIEPPVKTSHPDKVVITEMFWYGCPHCFRFEPYVNKLKTELPPGVVLEQVPSVLNPGWMEHARAFFALKLMGENEKVHEKLFNAIHIKRMRLNNADALADFVAGLGVDKNKFLDYFHSFAVDTMVRKSRQKERKYGHNGVPAIIIDGKYRTSGSMTGSNARMIQVIKFLVNKELAAKK